MSCFPKKHLQASLKEGRERSDEGNKHRTTISFPFVHASHTSGADLFHSITGFLLIQRVSQGCTMVAEFSRETFSRESDRRRNKTKKILMKHISKYCSSY